MMKSEDRTNCVQELKDEHRRCINMHEILVRDVLERQRNRMEMGQAMLQVYAMEDRIAKLEAEGRDEGVDLRCNYR